MKRGEGDFNGRGEDFPCHSRRSEGAESSCSTCSSTSSSSEDEEALYQLPRRPRGYYGGTRASYVPNDALLLAQRHGAQPPRSNPGDDSCVIS